MSAQGRIIMNFDDDDISSKSQLVTLFLCLFFGRLGAHRFYVGKYITGTIYLLCGTTSIVMDVLGYWPALFLRVICIGLILFDLYALYSDSFTDKQDRLVLGKEKALVYDTYKERDKILFEDKLNKIMLILCGIAFYLIYFLVLHYIK
jgi:TM2 domain-containing membrane protein YozV